MADLTGGIPDARIVGGEAIDLRQVNVDERRIGAKMHVVPEVTVGDDVKHNDFVTQSWVPDPLKFMLAKVPGFGRTGGSTASPKGTPEKKR